MVLSGTLREFILADVCQLLTQQKITGKLILTSGQHEAIIVFKKGLIVSAEKDNETLSSKLFNLLTFYKQNPASKMRDFFATYEGDLHKLSLDVVSHGFLSKEFMRSFSEAVVEDIACSLFLWSSGNYKFASLRSVDNLIPLDISFPVENIVMEAMRRVDEWHRMVSEISSDLIFVRQKKDISDTTIPHPISDSAEHIYYQIDGTSPVSEIIKISCLTEYKVFEAINTLLQQKRIFPLSEKYSRSVQAAIQKKERDKVASPSATIFSILITMGIILLILLISWFIFKGNQFYKIGDILSFFDQYIYSYSIFAHNFYS